MSAAAELRERIEELSSAIERQILVLRDLEISRSDARRALNAICDPLAQLPVEISSAIFMCCLPIDNHPRPNSPDAPMLLRSVCRLWSDIALATPSLWAAMRLEFPSVDPDARCAKEFELWLNRAGNQSLSLSLGGSMPHNMNAVIRRHAHQVQTLELRVASPSWDALQRGISFSALQKLIIYAEPQTHEHMCTCLEILHGAPLLVDCEFVHPYCNDNHLPILTHPCLRHLRLGNRKGLNHRSSAKLLRHLTLPALETLIISVFDISNTDFASFLARSSAPLRTFHIMAACLHDLEGAYLRLIPSLKDLTLKFCNPYICTFPFFHSMATRQDFLPNLCNLTIIGCFPSEYDTVLTLVRNRCADHASLSSPRIIFPYSTLVIIPGTTSSLHSDSLWKAGCIFMLELRTTI